MPGPPAVAFWVSLPSNCRKRTRAEAQAPRASQKLSAHAQRYCLDLLKQHGADIDTQSLLCEASKLQGLILLQVPGRVLCSLLDVRNRCEQIGLETWAHAARHVPLAAFTILDCCFLHQTLSPVHTGDQVFDLNGLLSYREPRTEVYSLVDAFAARLLAFNCTSSFAGDTSVEQVCQRWAREFQLSSALPPTTSVQVAALLAQLQVRGVCKSIVIPVCNLASLVQSVHVRTSLHLQTPTMSSQECKSHGTCH